MTQKKKENELDPNTQLETLPFAASIDAALRFPEADIGNGAQHFGGSDDCNADKAGLLNAGVNGRSYGILCWLLLCHHVYSV
jgi:hypothetical protein